MTPKDTGRPTGSAIEAAHGSRVRRYAARPSAARDLVTRLGAHIPQARARQQLRLALEAGDLGTFTVDVATGIGHLSPRAAQLMGQSAGHTTITRAERMALIHPDDRAGVLAARDAALAGGRPMREEYRMLLPDGTLRWLRTEAIVQRAADGAPRKLTGVVRDITELRAAQDEQRRTTAELRHRVAQRTMERDRLWELSRDLMLVFTMEGRILAANPSWSRVLGWGEDELIGRRTIELMHPDDRAKLDRRRARLAVGEQVSTMETRVQMRNGDYRWISWATVSGDALMYTVGRDVTEERAAAEQLAEANRQLRAQIEEREQVEATLRQMQRLEAIGQLTSGVAHDFNNLLTVILGNLEALRRMAVMPAQVRRLTMMQQAADRGAKLTGQLLAFARRQRLEPRPVDLNGVVTGMMDLLRSTLGHAIRIDTALHGGETCALADQTQLELVILNLAINARDAMAGAGALRIETGAASVPHRAASRPEEAAAGDYVTVAVADTGTGMTPEVRAQAFEPFFTTKEVGKGTGLGLPQVFGFAKQSGGGVHIDTAPGRGTTVTVFLPRATTDLAAAAPGYDGAASGRQHV